MYTYKEGSDDMSVQLMISLMNNRASYRTAHFMRAMFTFVTEVIGFKLPEPMRGAI